MAKDVISELNELIQLDYNAVAAYQQAIEACDHVEVKGTLGVFMSDHERHIANLSSQVIALGGTPPAGQDFTGKLLEGFTSIASHGDQSALLSMRGNEELTNRKYSSTLELVLPEGARAVVEQNYQDEQRHLAWIKDALDKQIWERQAA